MHLQLEKTTRRELQLEKMESGDCVNSACMFLLAFLFDYKRFNGWDKGKDFQNQMCMLVCGLLVVTISLGCVFCFVEPKVGSVEFAKPGRS